jgi:hypothetical protein
MVVNFSILLPSYLRCMSVSCVRVEVASRGDEHGAFAQVTGTRTG